MTDTRAHALRARYHELFQAPELPVPVESIAEDLLGLHVEEAELDGVSGLLYPADRQIYVNAAEPKTRRRFTLAHELGHWVCQHLEGRVSPVYCRSEEIGVGEGRLREREANVFAAELLMPRHAVEAAAPDGISSAAVAMGVSAQAMQWRLYTFGLAAPPS
ncbi:MAG: ImmA/IrrE family metallo-endopeptidase [Thermoleophilia bacterium]|nr:ImmA/IrrE family metallo-endopeptidase [Thermoleophilia bacterium]